jgi:hypothetical protein
MYHNWLFSNPLLLGLYPAPAHFSTLIFDFRTSVTFLALTYPAFRPFLAFVFHLLRPRSRLFSTSADVPWPSLTLRFARFLRFRPPFPELHRPSSILPEWHRHSWAFRFQWIPRSTLFSRGFLVKSCRWSWEGACQWYVKGIVAVDEQKCEHHPEEDIYQKGNRSVHEKNSKDPPFKRCNTLPRIFDNHDGT